MNGIFFGDGRLLWEHSDITIINLTLKILSDFDILFERAQKRPEDAECVYFRIVTGFSVPGKAAPRKIENNLRSLKVGFALAWANQLGVRV